MTYRMKVSERKIKKHIPFADLPAQLRRLADALEGQTGKLPAEWQQLPCPIAKLKVTGESQGGEWKVKIKIKAEPAASPEALPAEVPHTAPAPLAPPAASSVDYKQLKKRMKASFRDIGKTLEGQKLPSQTVMEAFLADSDRMMAFSGEKYGASYYPAYRQACQALRAAFGASDLEAFQTVYTALARLKKDCHQAFK